MAQFHQGHFGMQWPIWGNLDMSEVVRLRSALEQEEERTFLRLTRLFKREKILFNHRNTPFFVFLLQELTRPPILIYGLIKLSRSQVSLQTNYMSLSFVCVYI